MKLWVSSATAAVLIAAIAVFLLHPNRPTPERFQNMEKSDSIAPTDLAEPVERPDGTPRVVRLTNTDDFGGLFEKDMDIEQVVDRLKITHVRDVGWSAFRLIYACSCRELPGKEVTLQLDAENDGWRLRGWAVNDGDVIRDYPADWLTEVDIRWAKEQNERLKELWSKAATGDPEAFSDDKDE